jgi:phosphoenolpyruvate carboxykinase (GTP)
VDAATLDGLLNVDRALWENEVAGIKEFYAKFGYTLPNPLAAELDKLEKAL